MKSRLHYFVLLLLFPFSCGKESVARKDQEFTGYFRRTSGVVATDGCYSIPLSDGRSLFTYSDSYVDNYDFATHTVPCMFQVRNALQVFSMADPSQQTTLLGTGTPASFFALGNDNSYWFWPQHGYQYGDTVYVFLQRLHTPGTGFELVDSSYIAKLHFPDLTLAGYSRLADKHGVNFGTSVVQADGYRYVYGVRSASFGNDLCVARFPENDIYAAWEYYTGSGWGPDVQQAASIYSEFTSSFYVVRINGRYVLLTTEFSVECNQGKMIYAQVSDQPYGPFTGRTEIWQVDDLLNGTYPVFYIANAHPEFDNSMQELLVTYCINGYGPCETTCFGGRMDPDIYRPKAIRVPYSLLGVN